MSRVDKDLYKILAVSNKATPEEIEFAYQRMKRLYHSENNNELFAAKLYTQALNAYDILKDPDKRDQYDAESKVTSKVLSSDLLSIKSDISQNLNTIERNNENRSVLCKYIFQWRFFVTFSLSLYLLIETYDWGELKFSPYNFRMLTLITAIYSVIFWAVFVWIKFNYKPKTLTVNPLGATLCLCAALWGGVLYAILGRVFFAEEFITIPPSLYVGRGHYGNPSSSFAEAAFWGMRFVLLFLPSTLFLEDGGLFKNLLAITKYKRTYKS